MKNILICLGLACGPFLANAASMGRLDPELRATNFERLADATNLIEQSSPVRPLLPQRQVRGNLSIAISPLIESLAPYDLMDDGYKPRPEILDDIYYEQLFVRHPITGGEHYYPMIAKAIRYPRNYAYVAFEIDETARFQDGSPVTSENVMASVRLRLKLDPKAREIWDANVINMTATSSYEVRFRLQVSGQEARDTIAFLARTNIVKGFKCRMANDDSPVSLDYISTGPYVIEYISQTRVGMRKNSKYWALEHPVRQGFFNFQTIDLKAAANRRDTAIMIGRNGANFYQDVNAFARPLLGPPNARQRVSARYESNRLAGHPLRTLTFNLKNKAASDPNVRAAVTLAYDFDAINTGYHAKRLKRPQSLLQDTAFAPSGTPSPLSLTVMAKCLDSSSIRQADDFSTYGNAAYLNMPDSPTRAIAAQSLLRESGYYMKDGFFYSRDNRNREVPLVVSILVRAIDYDLQAANRFATDLNAMGVAAEVSMARNEDDFHFLMNTDFYTLYTNDQTLSNADGWPDAQFLKSRGKPSQNECVSEIISEMNKVDPRSELYRATADAVARLDQLMNLNIFMGEPAQNEFALSTYLAVPPRLSLARIHMYGYWQSMSGMAAR